MFRFAEHFVPHCIINVAFFVPLGLAFPFIGKSASFLKTTTIGLLCSFTIEFWQCFVGRDSNIDDLICNTFGVVVGYLLYLLMRKLFPKFTKNGQQSAKDLWLETLRVKNESGEKSDT